MMPASERCAPEFILEERGRFQALEDWESERAEVEDIAPYYRRKSAGIWTGLAALAVALGAVVVYGYSVLRQQNIQLGQIPFISKSIPAIGQNLTSLEKELDAWRTNQSDLATRVQRMNAGWAESLGQTQQQTQRLIAHTERNLILDMNHRNSLVQAQLSQLANDRNLDRVRLAQLEEQLVQARDELETARREYTSELLALREQQGEERRQLASLNTLLATQQVAFEVHKNRAVMVSPGVSLKLTAADVRRQQFDGWIYSASGNEDLYVQNQGVLRPVMFCPNQHDQAMELVVTKVTKDTASGYLLIPARNAKGSQANAVAAEGGEVSPTVILPSSQNVSAEPGSDPETNDLR